jgi:ABC-2 type transport system permease protein
MRELRGIYIVWYRDVLRLWRDKARIASSLGLPLLLLVIFGSGLSGSMGMLAPGVDYTKFMFPGIIGMTVLMTSLMSGVSVVWDRQFGFLKEVLVAPINRISVAVGKILGGATIAIIQGALMFVFAPFVGVTLTWDVIAKALPIMFVLAASLAALGILVASRMKSMEGFQMVMQMLIMPMIFLSGVFFPMSNLPTWMDVLVKVNPVTYGVDPLRQVLLPTLAPSTQTDPASSFFTGMSNLNLTVFDHAMSVTDDLIIVGAFGIIMTLLAMRSFGHQE